MKQSIHKSTHTGTQPIRVLKHNLTHRLVDLNKELISELIRKKYLKEQIVYHITEKPIIEKQSPYIDANGVINIHETFLSYLWIISFSILVLYEEGVAIPSELHHGKENVKKQNKELIDLTIELFHYGKSLIRIFSKWDKEHFPNPEYFCEDTEEGNYILRVNNLYIKAVNFILCHEIAHAELQHIQQIKSNGLENENIKILEKEADDRAIELMLSTENSKAVELGIFVGISSLLFFADNFSGGSKHPNKDERILNYLKKISPSNDHPIWAFGALFLKLWNEQFSLNLLFKKEYDNYKQMFYDTLSQIEK